MAEPVRQEAAAKVRRRFQWRPFVRALHRDLGYVAVGLTFVYALSGLAVNHISQWDPNFRNYRTVHQLRPPLPQGEQAAAREVLSRLRIRDEPQSVHSWGADRLDIRFTDRTLLVNPRTGRVVDEGKKPRFLIRAANWLHLNRGKKAWTVVADLYAVGLLLLACTGMLMLPGKNGMRGRGGILVAIGVAIPILYVALSGGPRSSTHPPKVPEDPLKGGLTGRTAP